MAAPSYQSIATFDYVVSPHSDDFGPFTSGTTTGGLQEALTTAGPGFGVVGMFSLGQDGTSDYDGFVFEGNGCLIDGQNFASTAGLFVTGRSREVFHFSLRNFRVQNCKDYGIGIGRQLSIMSGSWAGLVKVENFDLNNCGWIRVWSSEHVLLRNGRCRVIPDVLINGWFITSQHSGAGNMITRDVVLEDLVGETGSAQYDTTLEVQGNLGGTNADVTRDVLFRRCYLKGRASKDWFIDDTVNVLGPGAVESLTFEDCMFDSMASQTPAGMIVSNASEGYVSFDHCDFVNGAALPTTSYVMNSGGSPATRPLIVRRPQAAVTYPNQNFGITVQASPFTFTNTHRYVMVVTIDFIPRGGMAVATGEAAGAFNLSSGDALRVSYTGTPAPSMTAAPLL